jgi:hypothetical protein
MVVSKKQPFGTPAFFIAKHLARAFLLLSAFWPTAARSGTLVDFSGYDVRGDVSVSHHDLSVLEVTWSSRDRARYRIRFNLARNEPLLKTIEAAPPGKPLVLTGRDLDVNYRVTLGTRHPQTGWPYIFFDQVGKNEPAPVAFFSRLNSATVRVRSESKERLSLVFSGLAIGPYSGDLICYFYSGSPFVQFQASMLVNKPWVAYIYDALVHGELARVAYASVLGAFQEFPAEGLAEAEPGESAGIKVKHRMLLATMTGGSGSLALAAPPHAGFYPLDRSDNFGFFQAGKKFFGTKMSYWGDHGYVPWIDAPQGATQRMDAFLFISPENSRLTFERVLAYTHGDVFKPIPGHYTMAEHFHPEFTQAFLNGQDTLIPFKNAMKSLGVQIVQPMEFHLNKGRMHPVDNTDHRLAELRAMYELFAANSDADFLLIPGEEYNEFFGGHWSYIFPRPIYFTGWHEGTARAYRATNVISGGISYPLVYQINGAQQMYQLLKDEGGAAWTAHPRIKDSQQTPDALIDNDYYRDTTFLAGDWKAMPADLSKDRLGFRSFQLMDETAQWGYRKSMLGEVDTFDLDSTHEIYANLSINYLQLSSFPSSTNWSTVVNCIRNGQFFTTTGELLIHSWSANLSGVTADVEWYFPPSFAEITWGDDGGIHKRKKMLSDQLEFGRNQLTIAVDLANAHWVRFEIWDIARDGAFTQSYWLKPPAAPQIVPGRVTGFTLIDADTDAPVPGCDPLPPDAVLDLNNLPVNLTVRANVSPMIVDRVVLALDDKKVTQTRWPYCLTTCSINQGLRGCPFYDYNPSVLNVGHHVLSATPFRGETAGKPLTLDFSVTGFRAKQREEHP